MEKDFSDITDSSLEEIFFTAHTACANMGWDIDYIHENGFQAVTKRSMSSWGELITIEITESSLNITSKCLHYQILDYGKNKKNLRRFYEEFDSLFEESNKDEAVKFYHEIEHEIAEIQQMIADGQREEFTENTGMITSFKDLFKPKEGYYVTPILVGLNILIYIIASLLGTHFFAPTADQLLNAGGNFSPYTMNGEYWRLLSSCFLHGGLFHLLFNMYALLYIGFMLEGKLGSSKFTFAYLVCGISASAVSNLFNPNLVSVGASGAIFGMYGVFLALLTTKIIDKRTRKTLMPSISIFVFYNIMMGFSANARGQGMQIDNAAHIGGLLSGMVIGYAMYYVLKKNENRTSYAVMAVILIAMFTSIALAFEGKSEHGKDILKYEKLLQKYSDYEDIAIDAISQPFQSDLKYSNRLNRTVLPAWKGAVNIADSMKLLQLPLEFEEHVNNLYDYSITQRDFYSYLSVRYYQLNGYNPKIDSFNLVLQRIIDNISHYQKAME